MLAAMRGGLRPVARASTGASMRCGGASVRGASLRGTSSTAMQRFRQAPGTFLAIPVVAAGVGFGTNYLGVEMLFYPIEYFGIELWRLEDTPWGLFGWQGVVPTKTKQMAERLVDVITAKLLSLPEAFGRIDDDRLGRLLCAPVAEAIARDAPQGAYWARALAPFLPWALAKCVRAMQRDIVDLLDLQEVRGARRSFPKNGSRTSP